MKRDRKGREKEEEKGTKEREEKKKKKEKGNMREIIKKREDSFNESV